LRGQVARRPTPNNKPHGLRLRSLTRRRTPSCMRFVTHRPRSSGNPPAIYKQRTFRVGPERPAPVFNNSYGTTGDIQISGVSPPS